MDLDLPYGPMSNQNKRIKGRKKRAKSSLPVKSGFFSVQNCQNISEIRINTPEFSRLLLNWYKQAADSGLRDIEAPEFRTYQEPGQLRANSLRTIANSFNPETRHYYARLRCFLTFNSSFNDQYDNLISAKKLKVCELLSEGVPYRTILEEVKCMRGPRLNLWSIGQLANHFVNISTLWNTKNHNGMDFEPDI